MHRFICIHGHFYQPPRENPWLEAIEIQDSAYPYHDWNARITAECYAPNADSRILDEQDRIVRITNNYGRISFNFGPTLLSWLELHDPATYRAILAADRKSGERFSGHGSALAQAYNHLILPLASRRDKRTQVLWGLADFERRFGRTAAGLWLPETAVDTETLEVLAEAGVAFTILAPAQAARVRSLENAEAAEPGEWHSVKGGRVDTTTPYLLRLPSGRSIVLFFYDGGVSQSVAFEQLLSSGRDFADRLLGRFPDDDERPRLVHIATDGETYGHHHKFGDMALAWALDRIESGTEARMTNYGEYLELHPPTHEVQIVEGSSWSCSHGLGRWREACGCSSGSHPGWSQAWRAPLREALDWLRDELATDFERAGSGYFGDPWEARDGYIDLILERSRDSADAFFERHSRGVPSLTDRARAIKLLELQRQCQLMYTSCAWFFDEVSGIETIQVLQYAARAIQLGEELFGRPLEPAFLDRLALAPSNRPEYGDGRAVYERRVRPSRVDLPKAGANFAAGILFPDGDEAHTGSAFAVRTLECDTHRAGKARLVVGRMAVASKIVPDRDEFDFAFLHLGDHNLSGAVRRFTGRAAYEATSNELREGFSRGDLPEVLRLVEQEFPGASYSLQSLFRDEQRRILDHILETTSRDAEAVQERLYRHNAALLRFMNSLDTPAPRALETAAELVFNNRLRRVLEAAEFEPAQLENLLEEIRSIGVELDRAGLGYAAVGAVDRAMNHLAAEPDDPVEVERLKTTIDVIRDLPFDVDLRRVENSYYRLMQDLLPARRESADAGDGDSRRWVEAFTDLGRTLRVAVP